MGNKYVDAVAGISPSLRAAGKTADINAALVPPPAAASSSTALVPAKQEKSVVAHVKEFAPQLGAAAAGSYLWKKHRVLGLFAGLLAGDAASKLYHGDTKGALCDLAVDGAAIAGVLYHKKNAYVGFAGGLLAGAIATSFVDGSPAKKTFYKLKSYV